MRIICTRETAPKGVRWAFHPDLKVQGYQPYRLFFVSVSGWDWLDLIHTQDRVCVEHFFSSSAAASDRSSCASPLLPLVDSAEALTPCVVRILSNQTQMYHAYTVIATWVQLGEGGYAWVFVDHSVEPMPEEFAERNLLAVLVVVTSLAQSSLQTLVEEQQSVLSRSLPRHLSALTESINRVPQASRDKPPRHRGGLVQPRHPCKQSCVGNVALHNYLGCTRNIIKQTIAKILHPK